MKFIFVFALILTLAALISPQAYANDGGIPYIIVDAVKSKLPDGPVATVKGGDAFKLYSVLPRDFVYDVSRSLTITSKGRTLAISCRQNDTVGDRDPQVGDPATTECTFSLGQAFDPSGSDEDTSVWEPEHCGK